MAYSGGAPARGLNHVRVTTAPRSAGTEPARRAVNRPHPTYTPVTEDAPVEEPRSLSAAELRELQRTLAGTKVLSIYLDTRVTDPAMRESWRPALHNAIREARAHVAEEERAAFDRAAGFLDAPVPSPGGAWGAPGWVAFVTADGPQHLADLPVTPGTLARWRDGPVIAPYLRAFKQRRPVIVALVESGSARLYRYSERTLERLDELTAPDTDSSRAGRPTAPAARGMSAPTARGAVDTEAASRRRLAAFRRLAATLAERVVRLAGPDAWVLVGGAQEWARLASEELRRPLRDRVLLSDALDHGASENAIKDAAKHAATELRGAQGLALVGQLLDRSGTSGRAAAGVPAVQRALRAQAVDLLLVSPAFIRGDALEAEDAVRTAFAEGADVDIPSGHAAERLDRDAGGIAARLRFAIDAPEAVLAG